MIENMTSMDKKRREKIKNIKKAHHIISKTKRTHIRVRSRPCGLRGRRGGAGSPTWAVPGAGTGCVSNYRGRLSHSSHLRLSLGAVVRSCSSSPRHPCSRSPRHPCSRSPRHPCSRSPRHPCSSSPRHPCSRSPRHPYSRAPRCPFESANF
jgi:hypothetical protein